jgi:hypothetical protein
VVPGTRLLAGVRAEIKVTSIAVKILEAQPRS